MAVAIGLVALLRLLSCLAFVAGAVSPSLVVALPKATHALDHAEIVIGILPVGFRQDAIARCGSLACKCLVLVEYLVGISTHPYIGSAAVEDLVAVRRTVGIVMLLVMVSATTAATIAAAARPLPIV